MDTVKDTSAKLSPFGSKVAEMRAKSPMDLICNFSDWIEEPLNKQRGDKKLRDRIYDLGHIFWLFLWQAFAGGKPCTEGVDHMLAWLAAQGKPLASPDSSAYCQARKRLELDPIYNNCIRIAKELQNDAGQPERLCLGRPTRVIDGSSTQLADTSANQKLYPQPSGQKKGCGSPVMRIVVMFSLETGAVLNFKRSSLHTSEHELFRQMWDDLKPGDIALTDCHFASYGEIWSLQQRQVDVVMAFPGRRTANLRYVQKLGRNDWLVEWSNDGYRPEWMDDQTWEKCPPTMLLRQTSLKVHDSRSRKNKVEIVTTLLDPQLYPKRDLLGLFKKRWHAELFFRDIKTTMGMEQLHCKSPEMVHKELAMYMLAYNLIRAVMFQAASKYPIAATRISFKRTWRLIEIWGPYLAQVSDEQQLEQMYEYLLYYIGQSVVGRRPGRYEPRAVKRRPKNYPRLTAPRHQYKEIPHRNRYKKAG